MGITVKPWKPKDRKLFTEMETKSNAEKERLKKEEKSKAK